ncbi:MAG: methylated-DNA--[protein]-cysteine S-methyltransferase [Egibacteraceae bacterium]
MTPATRYTVLDSPLGPLLVTATTAGLTGLYTPGHGKAPDPSWTRDDAGFDGPADQLAAYFAGRLRAFDLPLAATGTTFQREVWDALAAISYGETVTYGQLAERSARPGGARAVGAAVGRNPLSIVVPCHRVVGADGRLTGYAGGVEAKAYLLELEGQTRLSLTSGK